MCEPQRLSSTSKGVSEAITEVRPGVEKQVMRARVFPRRWSLSAILSSGFRPFFLLAGVYAALIVPAWLALLVGYGLRMENPALWHGHEMLFGVVSAAIAGFLLTSVPVWTGAPAVRSPMLAGLALLWLVARILLGLPTDMGLDAVRWAAIALDMCFLPALSLAIGPSLVRARSRRNYGVLLALAVLVAANAATHARWLGYPSRFDGTLIAAGTVLLLVTIIGGRIVPLFTRSALSRRGLPSADITAHRGLDVATLALTAGLLLADGIGLAGPPLVGLAGMAAAAHAVRLARWGGMRSCREPIVFILHVGYAWIPLALVLRTLSLAGVSEASAWLHALTIGAFGTMVLAMMSRVALGHTGRPLVVAPQTVAAYGLITLAALARVSGPALPHALYRPSLMVAGMLWSLAFALFVATYFRILTTPRADVELRSDSTR